MGKMLDDALQMGRVSALLGILNLSDEEAYRHAISVAETTEEYIELAKKTGELEWSEKQCVEILTGALVHDIGKAFLPFGLQYSAKKLSTYEQEVVRMHPILGIVAVKNCEFSEIVENIILMHHANADGTGYPSFSEQIFNLENVPDYVWLVSYADRFEAMTNTRSFKKALSYPEAWEEILRMSRMEKLPYKFTRLFSEIIKNKSILPIEEIYEGGLE